MTDELIKQRHLDIETQACREEGHVRIQPEIGGLPSQVKDH
jgi:hypothetical protein